MAERPLRLVVDTGPLVSIYAESEDRRDACVEVTKRAAKPLLTSWAVVTETAWMIRERPSAILRLLDDISQGGIVIPSLGDADIRAIARILERYRDLKPQLADATIVHLAEREGADAIFTLDRRDFSVYRTTRRRAFRILP